METGSRWWGRGEESVFHRHRASVWEAEEVLEMMVRMVAQQCEGTECSQAVRVNTMLCVFCHHFSKSSLVRIHF